MSHAQDETNSRVQKNQIHGGNGRSSNYLMNFKNADICTTHMLKGDVRYAVPTKSIKVQRNTEQLSFLRFFVDILFVAFCLLHSALPPGHKAGGKRSRPITNDGFGFC